MSLDLFAGIAVQNLAEALPWYERLFGRPADLVAETEAVWDLAEHRAVFLEERAASGSSVAVVFVDDLDDRGAGMVSRGIEPVEWLAFGEGMREAVFRDPDGNELRFGTGAS
jgi:catechol 2,3-dioxygenase-like lactoylglutathione lyase family enzyme